MRFINEKGEVTYLADNLTLKELQDMGISVSLSDDAENIPEIWLVEHDEEQ